MEIYKGLIAPILKHLDSETWHTNARNLIRLAGSNPVTLSVLESLSHRREYEDERLKVLVGGIEFENPVMVGAGWDKEGVAVKGLSALGFSGVEVGSVLVYPQAGNPKPRQFLVGPGVVLNRLGFNSLGMEVVARNLEQYQKSGIPVGVSIGKNKDVPDKCAPEMHALVAKRLYDYATYFVVNVSSPNTPGLRRLQEKEPLTDIVQAVNQAMSDRGEKKPLFVKIAPDLTKEAVDDVIEVVLTNGLTGIIATNTTINADIKGKYGVRDQMGGLSGDDPDYRRMATEKVAHIYQQAGDRIEIIGVGGVKDGDTAYEKIAAGARVVQVVTAMRGEGPLVATNINRELIERMNKDGVKNICEIVGIEADKY